MSEHRTVEGEALHRFRTEQAQRKREQRDRYVLVLNMRVILVAVFIALVVMGVSQASEHKIDYMCCSWHTDRDAGYNENNYGLVYRYNWEDNFFTTGVYRNSEDNNSAFMAGGKVFTPFKDVDINVGGGFVSGYLENDFIIAPMATVTYKDTATFYVLPYKDESLDSVQWVVGMSLTFARF